MTSKRLVHLLVALGLVAGALAGAVVPAGAQPPGPEEPGQNAIFFPYIPNGVDIEEGNGPWYGVITVQNLEDFQITIDVLEPGTGDVITTAVLNAHASKTFSADMLGIDDESAGAVYVAARCVETDRAMVGRDGDNDDGPIALPGWDGDTGSIVVSQDRTTYDQGTDYSVIVNPDRTITIRWIQGGKRPAAGSRYTVEWGLAVPLCPRIGGIEKHASVDLTGAGRTTEDTVAVTGYTALPLTDLELSRFGNLAGRRLGGVLGATGQWNWAFPIVQTNNGWNSVIHVTNFSNRNNCGVTVTFYQSPNGFSDPSFGNFTTLLDAGEMVDVDLLQAGFPTGVNDWVGQAWVSADCAIAATVDRLKDETNMALTLIPQPRVDDGRFAKYGPLVFENFNGWNTGITLANLSDARANTVTISFYNQAGQLVSSDQRVLQPRAVEFIYRPSTADVGTGGPIGELQQVVVTGTAPLAAAADSVKYRGQRLEGQGQALSYLLQGGAFQGETLSVALIQKGTNLAPTGQFAGDTSGVQLFNASANTPATVEYQFFDQTGALVAPTLTGPVAVTMGPLAAATLYTPFFAEMPAGFQGSFLATVVAGGADAPVAAVSNNVNYDVVGDGTAVYNAFIAGALQQVPTRFQARPQSARNVATPQAQHMVTVMVFDQFGNPIAGVPVCVDVTSGPNAGTAGIAGTNCGVSDANGQFTFTYQSNGQLGRDTIRVWVDLNDDGVINNGETDVLFKDWIPAQGQLVLAPQDMRVGGGINDPNPDTWATVTVTNTMDPVPVVLVITDNEPNVDGSFDACGNPDDDDAGGFTTGGATNTLNNVPIWVCAGNAGDTFTVTAYHDLNANQAFDQGEPQIDTQTFTINP